MTSLGCRDKAAGADVLTANTEPLPTWASPRILNLLDYLLDDCLTALYQPSLPCFKIFESVLANMIFFTA